MGRASSRVRPSTTVTVTVDGVTNPPAGSPTLTVSTTSDTQNTSGPYTIVANNPVGTPSVTVSPPSNATGAKTEYVVTFATSSTGGLSNAAGSQITLTFPTGTGITNLVGSAVRVSGSQTVIGNCGAPSGQTLK